MPIFDVLPVPPSPPVGGTDVYCVRLPKDRSYRAIIVGCLSYGADEQSYDDPNTSPPDSKFIQAAFAEALQTLEVCKNDMIGTIQAASFKDGVSPPDGWLKCDGSSHLIADYPDLVAQSDLITLSPPNFEVPNLTGRFMRGTPSIVEPGYLGGSDTRTLTQANNGPHVHAITGITQILIPVGAGAPVPVLAPASPGFPFNTNQSGNGSAFSIIPPYMATDFYIIGR